MTPEVAPELTGIWLWVGILLVPIAGAACTAFTKVSIVLSALRIGLSAENLLPWSAVFALSVVLTAVIMAPIALASYAQVEIVGGLAAIDYTSASELFAPLREFLTNQANPDEVAFFSELRGLPSTDPVVLVPAFLITEITEALEMAVLLLVPLVAVDLLLAQVYALAGISAVTMQRVALPLKVLLFLSVGGWDLIIGSLVRGYVV